MASEDSRNLISDDTSSSTPQKEQISDDIGWYQSVEHHRPGFTLDNAIGLVIQPSSLIKIHQQIPLLRSLICADSVLHVNYCGMLHKNHRNEYQEIIFIKNSRITHYWGGGGYGWNVRSVSDKSCSELDQMRRKAVQPHEIYETTSSWLRSFSKYGKFHYVQCNDVVFQENDFLKKNWRMLSADVKVHWVTIRPD